MKKNIANIISAIRIILSLVLICMPYNLVGFCVIYVICGVTDVLDGYIARKTHTESRLGAKLDSAGDFLMFVITAMAWIIWEGEYILSYSLLITVIVLVRGGSILAGAAKFRMLVFVHTYGNKFTGVFLFCATLIYAFTEFRQIFLIAGIIAFITGLEELLIISTSKEPDLNRKSIFVKDKKGITDQ